MYTGDDLENQSLVLTPFAGALGGSADQGVIVSQFEIVLQIRSASAVA
jgi:hypothetical protein